MTPRPPPSTLFPYTTLFRSGGAISTNIPTGTARATFWIPGITAATAGSVNTRAMDTAYWKYPDKYATRSEEHTSELQSQSNLVCRLLLEKKKEPLIQGLPGT